MQIRVDVAQDEIPHVSDWPGLKTRPS
jgi:hypothetical protein